MYIKKKNKDFVVVIVAYLFPLIAFSVFIDYNGKAGNLVCIFHRYTCVPVFIDILNTDFMINLMMQC
jgi:hypothetical protein